MPTYQYACTACGHSFEQVQSFSEDSLTTCPQCQGRLRKVYNAVGVVFKGSGFYRTDSRSSSESGDGAKASEKKSDSGSEKKSDSGSGTSGSGSSDSGSSKPATSGSGSSGSGSSGSGSSGSTSGSSSKPATSS